MKCSKCREPGVFSNPYLCKKHFINKVENRILKTIRDYKLIGKADKVIVAASGGKDSTVCLHLLSKHYNVRALAIDEGIPGYRDKTLTDLRAFCGSHSIPLTIVSAREECGTTLTQMVSRQDLKPCTLCGALRRHLLNLHARRMGATRLATGHNLDDEVQTIMMNMLRNQPLQSARLSPSTGVIRDPRFVQRVKPLYFCTEREIAAYAFLQGYKINYTECPHAHASYRALVRDQLNVLEHSHPSSKANIVRSFLKTLPSLKRKYAATGRLGECVRCAEPSQNEVCKFCQIMDRHNG
jgi:uncharacterized protein (TIGR00269 family)